MKSPVEFALGIIKPLEELAPTRQLGADLAELGQNLCSPPTIDGWEGGRAWINRFTLLGRSNLAAAMLAGGNLYGDKLDPQAVVRKHAAHPQKRSRSSCSICSSKGTRRRGPESNSLPRRRKTTRAKIPRDSCGG